MDGARLLADIPLWQQDFFMNFFTGEYLAASFVVLLVWLLAHQLNMNLLELEADDITLERERTYEFRNDRPGLRNQLMLKIVLIGALLIALTVGTRTYLQTQAGEAAAAQVSVWNLLLYVFMSLLLLSQARLAALRASWFREWATIGPEVTRRWVVYSVVFLALMVLVAALLPTRYSMGLLATLNYVLGLLLAVLQIIVYVVLLIFTYPISLLMSLFGQTTAQPSQPEMPKAPDVMPAESPATADPLFEVIKSVLFWLIFLIIVGWALVHLPEPASRVAACPAPHPTVALAGTRGRLVVAGHPARESPISQCDQCRLEPCAPAAAAEPGACREPPPVKPGASDAARPGAIFLPGDGAARRATRDAAQTLAGRRASMPRRWRTSCPKWTTTSTRSPMPFWRRATAATT